MRDLMNRGTRTVIYGLAAAGLLAAVACKDLLKVQDPQSFASEKLDNPVLFPAVAAGAEGDFQLTIANVGIYTGLLSDEFWNTSTWIDWKDVSEGFIRKNWSTTGAWSGTQDALLRARFTAQDAAARFTRVMKDTANTSPLMVQVKVSEAWDDLELAMGFCESPPSSGAAAVSDAAMFKQAADKLTAALALVQAAHFTKTTDRQGWTDFVNAGLARANLMLGNYDAALQYAQAVTPGFEKDAQYSNNSGSQNNNQAVQGNQNFNRSFTIRGIWYPLVDTVAGYMKDPYSGMADHRLPLGHDNNNARGYDHGADGVTKFFSLNKTPTKDAPVAITKSAEMNLIQAEAYWAKGSYQTALDKMNLNRAAVGLPPFTLPTSSDIKTAVRDLLLQERFAALFGEGHRMQDLYRFGLVTQRLGPGRALKLPMSRTEIITNSSIGEGHGTCPGVS